MSDESIIDSRLPTGKKGHSGASKCNWWKEALDEGLLIAITEPKEVKK